MRNRIFYDIKITSYLLCSLNASVRHCEGDGISFNQEGVSKNQYGRTAEKLVAECTGFLSRWLTSCFQIGFLSLKKFLAHPHMLLVQTAFEAVDSNAEQVGLFRIWR
ncbi:hypothetical protein [Acetobacter senegalensis]|uniref:hypothetical protein n=1 Tax=Acetobacter senegalensis TaxID=446692 RepID=UPI00264B9644|nr:hypothetical protein [Acetobacter senegalensis]MDN7350910.1 hypothetical protein [Acetobacter senegalensis]